MARAAVLALAMLACAGSPEAPVAPAPVAPLTGAERLLAMLPQGAQVVIELDMARLRGNPVVGAVVTEALAARKDAIAGVPPSPLAIADRAVLAAYGVGTAQAATLILLAAKTDIADTTALGDGYYAAGPPEWVEQVQQRVALATTGEAKFALVAPAELLTLRDHAVPEGAPGASIRVTARLPFDARIALARMTGLDAAPSQLSIWADVVDDFAVVVDADAGDPTVKDAAKRFETTVKVGLAALAAVPTIRSLGLLPALGDAKLIRRGTWVRTVIAIGPAHLRRVVDRAQALLK
jgi:hypothetical protein